MRTDAASCAGREPRQAVGGARGRPLQNSQRVLLAKPRASARGGQGRGCQTTHRGGEPPQAIRRGGANREPRRASIAPYRQAARGVRTATGYGNGSARRDRTTGRGNGTGPRDRAARWGHRALPPSRTRGAHGHGVRQRDHTMGHGNEGAQHGARPRGTATGLHQGANGKWTGLAMHLAIGEDFC